MHKAYPRSRRFDQQNATMHAIDHTSVCTLQPFLPFYFKLWSSCYWYIVFCFVLIFTPVVVTHNFLSHNWMHVSALSHHFGHASALFIVCIVSSEWEVITACPASMVSIIPVIAVLSTWGNMLIRSQNLIGICNHQWFRQLMICRHRCSNTYDFHMSYWNTGK